MNSILSRNTVVKVVALCAAAMIISLTSSTLAGAIGAVGGRPALPRESEPRSQSIFIHALKPGAKAEDKVVVSNNSETDQTVLLYAADAIPSNTGSFTCKQRSAPTKETGSWIKLDKNEVTLKAGKSEIVDFTIVAPKNADVGEHAACIAFESKQDATPAGGNLRLRSRTAIRVAVTIPGELHREVKISNYAITKNGYRQTYTLTLQNAGNVSADTDVNVELKTLWGTTVYKNGGEYPVMTREKLDVSYSNQESPFFGGWYIAEASATYDKNASTWGTQKIEDPVRLAVQKRIIFLWPQPLAMVMMLILGVALAVAIAYPIRQHRLRSGALDSWTKFIVDKGDTLHSLAEQSGVNWKLIVKVNRLKPPYALKAGSTIYLPDLERTPAKKKKTKKRRT